MEDDLHFFVNGKQRPFFIKRRRPKFLFCLWKMTSNLFVNERQSQTFTCLDLKNVDVDALKYFLTEKTERTIALKWKTEVGLEGVKVVVVQRNSYPMMNSCLDIGKWIINRVEVNLL